MGSTFSSWEIISHNTVVWTGDVNLDYKLLLFLVLVAVAATPLLSAASKIKLFLNPPRVGSSRTYLPYITKSNQKKSLSMRYTSLREEKTSKFTLNEILF